MVQPTNKISQFWKELKRRKVLRVITVYAAVAFVILQLVEILAPSLRLPDWTMNFILVVLIVGFIIAIILSWIYDIHPEGGIVKTEPAHKVKIEEIPKSSNRWKIASYISFVVIVGLIVLNIIPRSNLSKKKDILDKSIAVLPFRNESSDQENTYHINGIMESILDNLSKIEDLRVISRNSVEQYRNNPKPTPVVAEEMNVSYIIEGSGQKIGNRLLLTLQLIVGKDDYHIWSKQYDRNIQQIEDLIDIQQEIAQLVASEIEAIIKPEEKQLIEKVPTTNAIAYDLYQRGREEHIKYWSNNNDKKAQNRAEEFYQMALEYDSTFAQAYTGLTWIYFDKNFYSINLPSKILDSIMIRTNVALSFDDQLEDTYLIKARLFESISDFQQAEENYETALNLNPNYSLGLRYAGLFYIYDIYDYVKGFSNLHKAVSIDRTPYLAGILRTLATCYATFRFIDNANYYNHEATKLDNDSIEYYMCLADIEYSFGGNPTDRLNYRLKAYEMDTTNTQVIDLLAATYTTCGKYEESLRYWKKYLAIKKARGEQIGNRVYLKIGRAYWNNGYKEEAKYYFNEQINISNRVIELGASNARHTNPHHLRLAQAYAVLGDKDKALENLRILRQKDRLPAWMLTQINVTSMSLDNIRDEPEFQQIVKDMEAKYHAEHERVTKWLEENDML
jgi:TolB-like protein